MTDRNKFEQMLEYLISEEQDKARELFHQLVVEKSREIYETILSEDFDSLDESDDEDDEEVEENFDFAEAGDEIGGDQTDDFLGDVEADGEEDEFGGEEDEFGGEEGDEGGLEDRVVDLEDALDELKAEFDKLMSDEEGEEDHADMFGGEEEGEEEEPKEDFMREYVEKVTAPKGGDNGVNTKSIVAKKNDMGGTTANILKGGESKGEGTKGGLLNPSTKEDDAGNVNVPGAKKAATLSKVASPKGGDDGVNKKSTLGA